LDGRIFRPSRLVVQALFFMEKIQSGFHPGFVFSGRIMLPMEPTILLGGTARVISF
jgi:hypothetical protein